MDSGRRPTKRSTDVLYYALRRTIKSGSIPAVRFLLQGRSPEDRIPWDPLFNVAFDSTDETI